MPRAVPCAHTRSTPIATDARIWGESRAARGSVRWCCHCGSVKAGDERWYAPREKHTADKLWKRAVAEKRARQEEVRRAS